MPVRFVAGALAVPGATSVVVPAAPAFSFIRRVGAVAPVVTLTVAQA
jgi:hypothetical protein